MRKKILTIVGIILTILLIVGGLYLFFNKENKYKYTIDEQKWLEENKNNVIDLYMPSDVAILTLSENGILFDFVDYFTKDAKVKINPVAYQLGEQINSDYSIVLVDQKSENDIKIMDDEYVVITKNSGLYNDSSNLVGLKIGVLKDEAELIAPYLDSNITYIPYESKELLLNALKTDAVNGIVGLKSLYLSDILNNNYHICYHISDLKKSYVLRLNGSNELVNSIISKEYAKFERDNYSKSYNSSLLSTYVKALNISEQDITNLNAKKYIYGYIDNGLYDNTYHGNLSGTNYFIIKSFASFANVDMKYDDEYSNLDELNNALKEKKVDFYFDNTLFNVDNKEHTTVTAVDANIVFLTKNDSKMTINSLVSLKDKTVMVLKNSKISKLLADNNISIEEYDNYNKMFNKKNLNKDTVIALELDNYEYYKTRSLSNFHISYIYDKSESYGFVIGEGNDIFTKLFNFYLEYIDINTIINIDYVNVYEYEGLNIFLLIAVILLLFIIVLQFLGKIRRIISFIFKRNKKTLSKDEKLKYIDNLTSLKNRAYLNDNIEKWDNSNIYPQIIIVVDLNNVAYINDNFGHEEGDKVITEAANILIQTQLPKTEIIRTDGNEFLIYMVEYEEKKAISYIRKLNREFKNLSHGFGAAIGYSIINDAIKTIDDAVNEATLDMKTNKEVMLEEEK